MTIQLLILKSLLSNDKYCRSVFPYIKGEYFTDYTQRTIFKFISTFINSYNDRPTVEALELMLNDSSNLKKEEIDEVLKQLASLETSEEENNYQWLVNRTEEFCKQQALHNAILESINILDDKNDKKNKKDRGTIPDILKDALAVSFDPTVGHDYIEDYDSRYDYYHRVEEKIPFDIEQFNTITKGGLSRKTLNVILAGTNVGKSLAMCHFATSNLSLGKNVLYITMEMAEHKIAERIDANLLDISLEKIGRAHV